MLKAAITVARSPDQIALAAWMIGLASKNSSCSWRTCLIQAHNESVSETVAIPLSPLVLEAVRRAAARKAAVVHLEMQADVNTLATLAVVAPWIGVLMALLGIRDSLWMGSMDGKGLGLGLVSGVISLYFWVTALGLAVGLISLWCYRYLAGRLQALDREMECAALDLVNQLGRHRGTWTCAAAVDRPFFGEQSRAKWRGAPWLTVGMMLACWWIQLQCFRLDPSVPLEVAFWAAPWLVALVFVMALLPAQFLCVRSLQLRRGGIAMISAALCFCWCIIQYAVVYLWWTFIWQ